MEEQIKETEERKEPVLKTLPIEYHKMILERMAIDKKLFMKEFKKSLQALDPKKREELKNWVREKIILPIAA